MFAEFEKITSPIVSVSTAVDSGASRSAECLQIPAASRQGMEHGRGGIRGRARTDREEVLAGNRGRSLLRGRFSASIRVLRLVRVPLSDHGPTRRDRRHSRVAAASATMGPLSFPHPLNCTLQNPMSQARRILVTAALPYANGPIHIGHLVEYLQTDIWVRYQRLRGHRCIYICADDTHGTAIMIRARQEGRREEDVIAQMQQQHERDFAGFQISFDNYGSTHSPENREYCAQIWQAIRQAGLVKQKDVEQLYDAQAGTFLADRFVRGTCPNPKCRAESTGRQLQRLRFHLHPRRTTRSGQHPLANQARGAHGTPSVYRAGTTARLPGSVDSER